MGWLKYEGTRVGEVYGLVDPRGENVAYVGKTVSGSGQRLSSHLRKAKAGGRSRTAKWLRGLLDLDLSPDVVVLETGEWTCDELNAAEVRWIAAFGRDALTNGTDGGDGGFNDGLLNYNKTAQTPERRAATAEFMRARHAAGLSDYSAMQAAVHPAHDPAKREKWLASLSAAAKRREAAKRAAKQ